MNVKEKLLLEKADEKVIRLYHEGIFYTAYGYSAVRVKKFLYPQVCLLEQKLKVGTSYFRVGIVQNSPVLDELPVKDAEGNFISSLTVPYTGETFELDSVVADKTISSVKKHSKTSLLGMPDSASLSLAEQQVLDAIRSLELASLTPVKAMQHVLSWAEQLQLTDEEGGV